MRQNLEFFTCKLFNRSSKVASIKRDITMGVERLETIQKLESKRDHIQTVKKERDEKKKQVAKLEQVWILTLFHCLVKQKLILTGPPCH